MTEKRFKVTNISKNGNTGLFWLGKDNLSVYDVVRLLNEFEEENEELIKDNEQLIKENCEYKRDASKDQDLLAEFHTEIEQLKKELSRYKEVNKLDIWKSSYSSEDALITELQDKCDKKQEHIVVLENKIRRMREAIHKLEWLATHRNGELIRENKELKSKYSEQCTQLDFMKDENQHMRDLVNENEQLKKEKRLLARFIRRNHDVTMISRILNE